MAENRRTCTSCGSPNEEDARFCEECGASLARVCATCGLEAKATARFCRGCGTPLESPAEQGFPDAGPSRKTVTVMFADLAGSTTFEERVDAETARSVIGRYHGLLRMTAERHRAGVTKYIGDGFMAVWGVPEIGPDDAAHAVDAAVELQERFVDLAAHVAQTHGVELALRVAVNTGEVVVGAGDADLVGDALNVGARLEAECPRGRVVVGEETWRSTRGRYGYESLGHVQVKGRSAPVAVYQWLGRQSEAADATPFVGRSEEVRRLQAVFDDAVAARSARLVTVIGDPGVGKSRLAAEFIGAQGDVRAIHARCVAEGTVALAPIVEVLRARDLETDVPAGVPERERLLRDLTGLAAGVPGSVEENFWALRRFVEVLAWSAPVLLVLDDIQWADVLLLDFIEHLVEWVQDAPVVVLALTRPEIREIRPDLATVSRWVSAAVHLTGLDARATAELAANVLGAARLPDELLRRLPASTGGNPLFVRELIGMLAHDGVLVEQAGRWRLTIDVDAIAIPPTIHALLASRLERLDPNDRRVLEIASVAGSDFSVGMVRALARRDDAGIKLSLNRLRRLEFAHPSGSYVGDEPVWRFHHVLIRDVAYRRLLKSDRAELHERLAEWLEAGGASVAFDSDEMAARHLESAHAYRVELGTLDEHTGALALRSARHYATSARRALDRDELVSAGTQAARGAALAAADGAVRAELLLIGAEAFLSAGDVAAGGPLVEDLARVADEGLAPWTTCYRCQLLVYTDPERLLEVDAQLQGAIDEFTRRADMAGLAKAHRVRAGARARLGRIGDCETDLFDALIAARRSGDHRQIAAALGAAPSAALWGPSPVPKAGGRCLDVVRMQRMTTAAPSLEATSMRHLAVLELLRGRADKARKMLDQARQIVADLGLRHGLMETELFAGLIESMEGDPVAAEPHFRAARDGLGALGVGADAGQAAALLARSVLAQGRIEEADGFAAESERLAGRNLKTMIAWRAVRAEILAAQGRHEDAEAMARDAVAVAIGTDLVLDHAEACLALSRVLAAAGDAKGAAAAGAEADRLYAAKEVAGSVGRTHSVVSTPAQQAVDAAASRLAVTNRCTELLRGFLEALRAHDVDGSLAAFADRFVYDDHRRLGGDPIVGLDAMRQAIERIFAQYNHFDVRVLAVRGERLNLVWNRWSDDAGNETTTLYVNEIGDDGLAIYQGRFDEDDFDGAYLELEERYYAAEGAEFAQQGLPVVESVIALNHREFDRFFGELSTPDLDVQNRSRSSFPDRSAPDLRSSFGDLDEMLSSTRSWLSAVRWMSPAWSVCRFEREAVGEDGEPYAWTRILVTEIRGGRLAFICEFDPEDEETAFAYAEERIRTSESTLAVVNRASEIIGAGWRAIQDHDIEALVGIYADSFVYDDRRLLSGDPIRDRDGMRAAIARVLQQFSRFESRVLAVRGEHLCLVMSRWSDDTCNETGYLHICEIGDDGRVSYDGRFDEDDFEGAYRELERRYYSMEGAEFAESGAFSTEWLIALNNNDFDRVFNELSSPNLRVENRSRSAFGDRTAAEFRASFEALNAVVVAARSWFSAVRWLSPQCIIARIEREATGSDGERYAWTWLAVSEMRDARCQSLCLFEPDDEEAAFTYAEELLRTDSRLAVTNMATRTWDTVAQSAEAADADAMSDCYADSFVFDDRRALSGNPLGDLRTACEGILVQYNRFDGRTLAVRGERLHLGWTRWSNDAGYETAYLMVHEVGDDGRFVYEGRFDEDDFEGAYTELERRYFVGEGAAFAEPGAMSADYVIALDRGDFDRVFGELFTSDFRVENRSTSAFPDRSLSDLRATYEDLHAMVRSVRTWFSAMSWVSPTLVVVRFEREAVGPDDENYSWSWVQVNEFREGRLALICRFDVDDEAAAFAYAEDRTRAATSRLAVWNRTCATVDALCKAMAAGDIEGAVGCYAYPSVYDDHRRLSGGPIRNSTELRAAGTRILGQYNHFEFRPVAVRGDNLSLHASVWSDDSGNASAHLHVYETGEDGRFSYEGRFDEDDFNDAYRELERRYYARAGTESAEAGATATEFAVALNRGHFDRAFDALCTPDFRVQNRSRSAFADRSVTEFRATLEQLNSMVAATRSWHSAMCWMSPRLYVSRLEREALGHDGEQYAWTYLLVVQSRGARMDSACLFETDDEDAAFAYAEELAHQTQ